MIYSIFSGKKTASIFRDFRFASFRHRCCMRPGQQRNKFTIPPVSLQSLIKLMFRIQHPTSGVTKINKTLRQLGNRPPRRVCTAIKLQNLTSFLRRFPRFPCSLARCPSPYARDLCAFHPSNHRDIDRAHFRPETPGERAPRSPEPLPVPDEN